MAFTVILFGLFSRFFYLLLGQLASKLIVNFDRSTDLLNLDNNFFKFLIRWDSIYFYNIAKIGYYKEKHWTVFFPLYPFLIYHLAKIFPGDVLILGVIFNNFFFLINGYLLFKFSMKYYSESDSLFISILYFIYPTTIIASSMYSETLFMFLFLCGLLLLKKYRNYPSIIFFGLSTITRSNGILFTIFIFLFEGSIITGILKSILMILPYISYQLYLYTYHNHLKVITPYSYIQQVYWENGLLKFYTINENIPNLFVALPFLLLYGRAILILLLKFIQEFKQRHIITLFNLHHIYKAISKEDKYKIIIFCCVILLSIQTILLIFYFHLQIYMRFIMYNPLTYFITFTYCNKKRTGKVVCMLLFNYSLIYTMLFCSYYPPT